MPPEGTGSYGLAMDPGAAQFARLEHFAEVVTGDPAAVRLDEAALAMAAVLRARPTDGAADVLDEMAAGCVDRSLDGLRRHIFDELGFAGDAEHYDEPRNSLLDVVLDRRRGLPILLATVVIEVGRRCEVPCVGIGMPMHFLVRAADDDDAFVDPFSGEALDRLGARRRFETLSAGRLPWDDRHLAPTPAAAHRVAHADQPAGVVRAPRRSRRPGAGRPDAGSDPRARRRRVGRSGSTRRRVQLRRPNQRPLVPAAGVLRRGVAACARAASRRSAPSGPSSPSASRRSWLRV